VIADVDENDEPELALDRWAYVHRWYRLAKRLMKKMNAEGEEFDLTDAMDETESKAFPPKLQPTQ
jgi:hypothetical protein